jgi:GYF domain 2
MDWQIIDPQGEPMAVTEEQLRGMLRLGHLKRSTLMWSEGMADWAPAEEARPDLFPALHRAAVADLQRRAPVVVPPQPVAAPTRRVVRVPRGAGAGRRRGGWMKWLIIFLLVGIGAGLTKIFTTPGPPGSDALKKAEEALNGAKTRGSGDTPGEARAATVMAETAEALRDAGITKGASGFGRGKSGVLRRAAAGLDANGFTAVCSVRGDTAVFLLHVPDLRKFTDEAKVSMGKMAWFAARMGWQELPAPRPARISVGLKGIVSYDRVLEGAGSEPVIADDEEVTVDKLGAGILTTVTGSAEAQEKIAGYFLRPAGIVSGDGKTK